MTREEFYEKYGDVKVKFSDYYKYTFNYIGELPDGGQIYVGYGGGSEDIYRHKVVSGLGRTITSLYPYTGTAFDKDGNVIDEFYDY